MASNVHEKKIILNITPCPFAMYVVSPALSDHNAICVIFRINHNSPPTSIRFRDFSEANAEPIASNTKNEFFSCSPPHSHPNEYADYLVKFVKKNNE